MLRNTPQNPWKLSKFQMRSIKFSRTATKFQLYVISILILSQTYFIVNKEYTKIRV